MQNVIEDEFSGMDISETQKLRMRRKRDGKCIRCGEPRVTKIHCEKHREINRTKSRERYRKKMGIPLDVRDQRENNRWRPKGSKKRLRTGAMERLESDKKRTTSGKRMQPHSKPEGYGEYVVNGEKAFWEIQPGVVVRVRRVKEAMLERMAKEWGWCNY